MHASSRASRASDSSSTEARRMLAAECKEENSNLGALAVRPRSEARRTQPEAARDVAADAAGLRRRRVRREDPRPRSPHQAHAHVAVRQQDPQGGAAALRGPRRTAALAAARECPRQLPVHGRRVRLQARERRPDAHVRRRGRPVPHQQALQAAVRRHAGQAAVDRLRQRDALRQRPGGAARHLRQGRQQRRVDRHARRPEGAVLGLRPDRAQHLGQS